MCWGIYLHVQQFKEFFAASNRQPWVTEEDSKGDSNFLSKRSRNKRTYIL